ncbi:MAG: MarR family winged helix-turn-helix transcriptional regulator [Thalassobaculales bacterium]
MSTEAELPFATTRMVKESCFCLHAQRAARALARRYDEALRPFGLSSGQFSLLMSMNRPAPPSMAQVASLLAMDRTTLTANLKPLVRRALALVVVDDADRRIRRLVLTQDGRRLLAAALPAWQATQRAIDAALAPGDPERLRADLRTLS